MKSLSLIEVRDRIHADEDWQSRSIDIEVFHFSLMIFRSKWSIRKTAKLLNLCASTTCEDLQLAKFSLHHPEVVKIRFRRDALTYMRNNR